MNECLEEVKRFKDSYVPPYRSEHIHELAAALAKAQGEFEVAELNNNNPFFKSRYADFKSIVQASRPALSKNGLSVIQDLITEDGATMLYTVLMHTSGQYIESRMRVTPVKNDIQSLSSYNTYLKRMAYASLVGVVAGDEDDDGEEAMERSKTPMSNKYEPSKSSVQVVSREEYDQLILEIGDHEDIADKMLKSLKIQHISDTPKSEYRRCLERIKDLKRTKERE